MKYQTSQKVKVQGHSRIKYAGYFGLLGRIRILYNKAQLYGIGSSVVSESYKSNQSKIV